jgi:TPR repeat protein
MFHKIESSDTSSLEKASEEAISKYIENKDVNFRQDLLLPLKQSLGQPKMAQFINSLIQRFSNDLNNADSVFLLGFLYRIKEEFDKAIPHLERAIEMGNANAMFLRGFMYMRGMGGPVNKVEAMKSYRAAIALNHSSAMNNLACLFSEGAIDGVDYRSECHDLLFKGAQLGNDGAIQTFNAFERASILMHYSFNTNQEVVQAIDPQAVQHKVSFNALLATGMGDGCDTAGDFTTVEHNLQFPTVFATLDPETKSKFLDTLKPALVKIYSDHTYEYQKLFKQSPFKAELLKIAFSENRYKLVQEEANRISARYLIGTTRDIEERFAEDATQQFTMS